MPSARPDWATVTGAVATAVASFVLIVTAIFAARQLRDARRTRHGQLLTDLSRRWDEPLIVESQRVFSRYRTEQIVALVEKVYEAGGTTEQEVKDLATLEALPNLWETIGVMQIEGAISLSVIDRMWGAAITGAWT